MRDRFIGRERAKQTESERESERERESTAYARGVKYYRTAGPVSVSTKM